MERVIMVSESSGRYELRLFDEKVLTIRIDEDQDGILDAKVLDRGEARLPLGLRLDGDGINRWLETRALPFNRTYSDRICMQMGIAPTDVARIVEVGRGLSLNDSYWLVPGGFDGRFADYNLYENGFSDVLAVVAYTGRIDLGSTPYHGLTPELSTGGSLRKAWRIAEDGTRLLYKGSTEGYVPGEWLSECAVSSVEEDAGIDHVEYWHDSWEGTECSVCPCFCSPEVSYVPFAVATGKTSLADAVASTIMLGEDVFEDLADMLVLDALVVNTDRHLTNFGFVLDAESGDICGLAPIFDNGRALFPNVLDEEIAEADLLAQYTRPAFGANSFATLASRVIGEQQLGWLSRLDEGSLGVGLEAAGMSPRRAARVARFLGDRAKALGTLNPVSRDDLAAVAHDRFPDAVRFAEEHPLVEWPASDARVRGGRPARH